MPASAWVPPPSPEREAFREEPSEDGSAYKTQATANNAHAGCFRGMAPKACRPFALFMKTCSQVRKGASRSEHFEEIKRLGKAWKQLPLAEQNQYRRKSQDLFQEQRATLRSHGVRLRCPQAAEERAGQDEQVGEGGQSSQLEGETIVGKFRCWKEEGSDGSCMYVGEGSYGCVLLSQTDSGRKVVVKVFKHSSRDDDMQYEVSILQRLQTEVPASCHCWFPEVLFVEERRVPFPHMALDYGGPSLHKVLTTTGPLSACSAQSVALQLKDALEAIHRFGFFTLT